MLIVVEIHADIEIYTYTSHYENYALPAGWQYATMGEICSKIVDGDHNPPSAQSTPTKYLMVSSRNIANDKICNITDVRYLTEHDFYCAHNRTFVEKGDILFTSVASLGRTCIYNLEGPVTFQRSVTVIKTHIYNKYLKLFLDSPIYQNYVNDNARGTAQKGFYINQISDSWVPIPPLAEQIRIATKAEELINTVCQLEILKDDLGNNIEKAKSIILNMAIMGRLTPHDPFDEPAIELLKRISPNFSSCDNRHYRQLSDSWETCQLKDIFDITMGQSPAGDTINGKYGTEFHQGKINFTNKYLAESAQFTTTPSKIAAPESLLLCVRAPVGIVNITKREICIGRGLCSLRPKYDIDSLYWLYMLSTLKDYFEENATGSTFKAISGDIIRNASIPFPPLSEQRRILSKINELFCLLDKITAEL